jgi:hypothetical protein
MIKDAKETQELYAKRYHENLLTEPCHETDIALHFFTNKFPWEKVVSLQH